MFLKCPDLLLICVAACMFASGGVKLSHMVTCQLPLFQRRPPLLGFKVIWSILFCPLEIYKLSSGGSDPHTYSRCTISHSIPTNSPPRFLSHYFPLRNFNYSRRITAPIESRVTTPTTRHQQADTLLTMLRVTE